jgi:hypothetical protein
MLFSPTFGVARPLGLARHKTARAESHDRGCIVYPLHCQKELFMHYEKVRGHWRGCGQWPEQFKSPISGPAVEQRFHDTHHVLASHVHLWLCTMLDMCYRLEPCRANPTLPTTYLRALHHEHL